MIGVNHTPSSSFNLFSVSHCLRKGWSLRGDFSGFTLTRGDSNIVFDIRIQAGSGFLWAAKIVPVDVPEGPKEVVNTAVDEKIENNGSEAASSPNDSLASEQKAESGPDVSNSDTKTLVQARYTGRPICRGMTKEYAHVLFGHANVNTAVATAKYLRFRMCTDRDNCRQIVICEGCARGKARRIGVNIDGTSNHQKASAANLFVYLDISTIREAGGNKVRNGVWVGLVDEYSGMATSIFIASKGAMVETVCQLLCDWKEKGKRVHTIRCDNASENRALMTRALSAVWQLGLHFQFTSVGTPQHNAVVEKFFDTLYNRARASMIFANIPNALKHLVCNHLILHLTNLYNMEPITKGTETKTKFEWWGISLPKFHKFLHPWGVAGVVYIKKVSTGKMEDRGKRMMYLGASLLHSGDTYVMFDNETRRTHLARNVKMLKKMFFRQDKSISSDQPHPLDTSFDHLVIEQEDTVTGDPHTDGVSTVPPASVAFDATDAYSVSTAESLPALILPPAVDDQADPELPDDLSSYSDSNPDSWTQATASTMAETDPYGFELEDLHDTDPASALADTPIIDVTDLPHGAVIDTSPVPDTVAIPAPSEGEWHTVTRTGRHVRRPDRFRTTDTTAVLVDSSYYSVFDLSDDTLDDSDSTDENPLYESGRPIGLRLRQEPYGLTRSSTSHAAYMRTINATLAHLSSLSAPPVPESTLVGATGTAFAKTTELQVMKLHEALLSDDKEAWEAAIEDEYQRFQKLKVFQVVPRAVIPTR